MGFFGTIRDDIRAVFRGDPAARTFWEVLFCYPGLHAIWLHRVAHRLWGWRSYFLGRLVSHFNRAVTGVEIHPGASLGRRVFIDHGSGVVVGETSEVGDDVIIYQGVVLGGTSHERGKRHPTIESNVVIGAHAVLLGPITVGERSRIGAHSVVIRSVPPRTTMVGVVARAAKEDGEDIASLEHARLPDPVGEALRKVMDEVNELRQRLDTMENRGRGG